ncbi:hypothetical protein BpHYR1_049555 [Brachionus plicatilis]|uniref:Uncharacterized protein n=1 Tax=Brachionus plicatilis TaxID=10195 RepID=A0A3M7SB34_BRAPC|nr:hypothetical protein BpHYR1_049555 [Brachionus plicatilis]
MVLIKKMKMFFFSLIKYSKGLCRSLRIIKINKKHGLIRSFLRLKNCNVQYKDVHLFESNLFHLKLKGMIE